MCSGYEHIRNNILCPSVHAGNAPSASALGAVSIHFLTLDITEIRHRDDTILIGNEIFYIHFSADGFDLCASFIVEFGTNGAQFGLDDTEQAFTVAENIFIVSDFFNQRRQFSLNFFSFQTGQLSQTHGNNGLCLGIVQTETL